MTKQERAGGAAAQAPKALARLSAFMPAYNEAENIEQAVLRLSDALQRVAREYELLVVLYAGCTDGTDRTLQRLAEQDPRLRVIPQPLEQPGYGVALRLGFAAARHPYVFYTDADNQFDPQQIDRLIQLIHGCDIAVGYREDRQDPLARRLTARAYNALVDRVLGTGLRDVDCAFKLFRRTALQELTLTCDSGLVDAELICRARRAGRRVKETAVSHFPRRGGQPHFEHEGWGGVPRPGAVAEVLRDLYALQHRLREERRAKDHITHIL